MGSVGFLRTIVCAFVVASGTCLASADDDATATLTPRALKVLVAGGHPDDPETGCGGTIAKYVSQGHEVTILYFTTGEAGIEGTPHSEAASIRRKEATLAAEILGAKPIFF